MKKTKLKFKIRPTNQADKEWIRKFITKEWGAEKVVAKGKYTTLMKVESDVDGENR